MQDKEVEKIKPLSDIAWEFAKEHPVYVVPIVSAWLFWVGKAYVASMLGPFGADIGWFSLSITQTVSLAVGPMVISVGLVLVRFKMTDLSFESLRQWSPWYIAWSVLLFVVVYSYVSAKMAMWDGEVPVWIFPLAISLMWLSFPLFEFRDAQGFIKKIREYVLLQRMKSQLAQSGLGEECIREEIEKSFGGHEELEEWYRKWDGANYPRWKEGLEWFGISIFILILVSWQGYAVGASRLLKIEEDEKNELYWVSASERTPGRWDHKISDRLGMQVVFSDGSRDLVRRLVDGKAWFELRDGDLVLDNYVETERDEFRRIFNAGESGMFDAESSQ